MKLDEFIKYKKYDQKKIEKYPILRKINLTFMVLGLFLLFFSFLIMVGYESANEVCFYDNDEYTCEIKEDKKEGWNIIINSITGFGFVFIVTGLCNIWFEESQFYYEKVKIDNKLRNEYLDEYENYLDELNEDEMRKNKIKEYN